VTGARAAQSGAEVHANMSKEGKIEKGGKTKWS